MDDDYNQVKNAALRIATFIDQRIRPDGIGPAATVLALIDVIVRIGVITTDRPRSHLLRDLADAIRGMADDEEAIENQEKLRLVPRE
jgi:hypothetical protein